MSRTQFTNTDGFTLAELMVVVALVGLLAAIAIPNYMKFAARARQAEAKIGLGGIYTAELSFSIEQGSYTECVAQAGFTVTSANRYYSLGFMAGPGGNCGPNGTGSCGAYGWNPEVDCNTSCGTFALGGNDSNTTATVKANSSAVLVNSCPHQTTAGVPWGWTATQTTFIVGAAGNISTSNTYDLWQIDQTKTLTNIQPGL